MKLWAVLRYVFGVSFISTGLLSGTSSLMYRFLSVLFGLLILPFVSKALGKTKYFKHRAIRILTAIGVFALMGFSEDSSESLPKSPTKPLPVASIPEVVEEQIPNIIDKESETKKKDALSSADTRSIQEPIELAKVEDVNSDKITELAKVEDVNSDKITELESELKKIPARRTFENLIKYRQLIELDSANDKYQAKVKHYEERLSPLLKVIKITDGDTVNLLTEDYKTIKIRLDGIDAPERGQEYGDKSTKALGAMLKRGNQKVYLESLGQDKYGRTIGKLYLPDGTFVNEELVKEGFAWQYLKYNSDKELKAAQEKAQRAKLGLWRGDSPISPWEYRAIQKRARQLKVEKASAKIDFSTPSNKKATTTSHWLNTSSMKRHNEGCRYYGRTKNGRPCKPNEGSSCGICGG